MSKEPDPGASARPRRRRDPELTRRAIVDALLCALKAGEIDPTTKNIATRAGVSERSIFVHFPGRDDLRIAAVDQQSADVEALIERPDPSLPLPQRIDAAIRQSEAIFALQRNPRVLGFLESQRIPAIDARMRLTDKRIRTALAQTFAPELTAAEDHLLDVLDAALGWPLRHHLIDRRGLTPRAASTTIRRTVQALLNRP
ncbi:TetR/AcrR family transcriptional regulator [Nocardia brasiliensis]|uniref:TetR/AcrR family transcriptional regulator n=1 Tax=Nocardia brasiliensis TaxID=37326 RepID=UPI001894156E|nr:TetR/AcrR family transcriptional regulator [Nocardia brasiliensis]MBF6130835.1 TetR/AcrR family transcriptional regulator [Nocardia brasiliensis]MBF6548261.1 TetR/AcrR family transcriptional regulator [Nocardia brasiliensis]